MRHALLVHGRRWLAISHKGKLDLHIGIRVVEWDKVGFALSERTVHDGEDILLRALTLRLSGIRSASALPDPEPRAARQL